MTEEIKDENTQQDETVEDETANQGEESEDTQPEEDKKSSAEPPVRNAEAAQRRIREKEVKIDLSKVKEELRNELRDEFKKDRANISEQDAVELKSWKEAQDYVKQNPEFAEFESTAAKWAANDAYKQVPMEQIFHMVAFKNAAKMGAEDSKKADEEAQKTKLGGQSFTPAPKDGKKQSDEDLLNDFMGREP